MLRRDLVDFGGPNTRPSPASVGRFAARRIPQSRSTSSRARATLTRLRPTATPTANSADSFGYLVALTLLLGPGAEWFQLLFSTWVLLVSVVIL